MDDKQTLRPRDPLTCRVWLSLGCTPGSATFGKLLRTFRTPESVFKADKATLATVLGEKSRDLVSLSDKSTDRAERIINFCEAYHTEIIPYDDTRYPEKLRSIPDPPVLLYCKGTLPAQLSAAIAVVGTRRMTGYGKRTAFRIAGELAGAGVVIVSGMARGIDAVAAAGALYARGKTIAVLGCGIDIVYPPEHRELARRIAEEGAVITEYPPGSAPERYHFPARNRLISALSDGVFVVEGTVGSGSLITADTALKQGKPLFALPGDADRATSAGPNLLIQQGARAVTGTDDILCAIDVPGIQSGILSLLRGMQHYAVDGVLRSLGIFFRESDGSEPVKASLEDAMPVYTKARYIGGVGDVAAPALFRDTPTASSVHKPPEFTDDISRRVYLAIPVDSAVSADDLTATLGDVSFATVSATLTMLQMSGDVVAEPGGQFRRG